MAAVAQRLPPSSATLYLIDISSFIFRAFFAIRLLTNRKREPTNAVYGVATMLARLIEDARPEFLCAVFDSPEPSFRAQLYADYKANRSEPPEELVPQFARIDELVARLHLPSCRLSGFEADDLIATQARLWLEADPSHQVVIVSGDKDLMQLVGPRVMLWDTMAEKLYSPQQVEEKFGVPPAQMRDFLALVGDTSDHVPGVPGIGPKTAADLLKTYGSLAAIQEAAASGQISGKKAEAIRENAQQLELSARLVTLDDHCPVHMGPEELAFRFEIDEQCLDFLKELDFSTLVEKWKKYLAGSGSVTSGARVHAIDMGRSGELGEMSKRFRAIQTEAAFREVLHQLERCCEFGFDLETTSLNPRAAELCGIALSWDLQGGVYIPVGHRGTSEPQLPARWVLEQLQPFLEDPRYKKIGQNLKYDWSVLMEQGLCPDGLGADTMVAAYLLEPEGRHNLSALAKSYLDYTVLEYTQVCGTGKEQISFDQVPVDLATRYSAEDAWIALHLWERLRGLIEAERLMEVFARVDLPLVPVLARMECEGVCIDVDYLAQLAAQLNRELEAIEQRIRAYTSGPINLNSPRQLAVLLFDELQLPPQGKTKTGYSTDASVLEALSPLHEVPRLLLEYREIMKLKSTYVDPLPAMRDPRTGRIHASFHQTVTATGRLSSSDPNLQNIPVRTERGRKIRKAFIPKPGHVLIGADYNQIELRILAHMSGDPELVQAFVRNDDVHRRTASELFDVPQDQVSDRQRSIAKAINFGLMYGKTPFGLSQELHISRREAQQIIERYFERYRGVKEFLERQVRQARENGFVTTLCGRKRWLKDIASQNPAVRSNAERMAMNTPIQGTAADLMKLAMIELDEQLRTQGFRARLICQVHDEVLLDCPAEEATEVQKCVVDVLEGALLLSVPLKVDAGCGQNWMELS